MPTIYEDYKINNLSICLYCYNYVSKQKGRWYFNWSFYYIYIYEFSCISNSLIVKMFILCFDPLKPNSKPNYVFTSLHQKGNNKNKAVMVSFWKKKHWWKGAFLGPTNAGLYTTATCVLKDVLNSQVSTIQCTDRYPQYYICFLPPHIPAVLYMFSSTAVIEGRLV